MATSTLSRTQAAVLLDGAASIKRIAWAFGCAKKDSDEERQLYKLLLAKVEEINAARGAP